MKTPRTKLSYIRQTNGDITVQAYEPVFKDYVLIARMYTKGFTVTDVHHSHGYFPQHRYGKLVLAYAKRRGYTGLTKDSRFN